MANFIVNFSNTNNINDTFSATLTGVTESKYLIWYYRKSKFSSGLASASAIKFYEQFVGSDDLDETVLTAATASTYQNFMVLDGGDSNIYKFDKIMDVGPSTGSDDDYEILRGWYYQIGVSYESGDDPTIIWADNNALVYAKLPDTINTPTLTQTYTFNEYTEVTVVKSTYTTNTYYIYNSTTGEYEKTSAEYSESQTYYLKNNIGTLYDNYFKNGYLKLDWTGPVIPDGLTSCWYQIQYIIGVTDPSSTSTSWKVYGDSYYEITSNNQSITVQNIDAGVKGKSIIFRIVLFDQLEGINFVKSNNTSVFYKITDLAFMGSAVGTIATLSVSVNACSEYRTTSIRPFSELAKNANKTYSQSVTAFDTSLDRPIFYWSSTGGWDTRNFKYEVYLSYNGIKKCVWKGKVEDLTTSKQQYAILYNNLTHNTAGTGILNELIYGATDNSLIGPYSIDCYITYTDIFGQSITSTSRELKLDFREAPQPVLSESGKSVKFGTDRLSGTTASVAAGKAVDASSFFINSNVWPMPDQPSDIILSNEDFVVAFQPGNYSYPAESVAFRKYNIQIYKLTNYSPGNQITESYFVGSPSYELTIQRSSTYSGDVFDIDSNYRVIGINAKVIQENGYYGVRIRSIDNKDYEDNASAYVIAGVYLIGNPIVIPKISITVPDATSATYDNKTWDRLIYVNNSNQIFHTTFKWPDDYCTYHLYHRPAAYVNKTYAPAATLYIEYTEDVTAFNPVSKITYQSSDKFYTTAFGGQNESGTISYGYKDLYNDFYQLRRVYTRIRIDFTTGLKLEDGEVVDNIVSVYSNFVINYLQIPTISERPHAIGINDETVRGSTEADTYTLADPQPTSATWLEDTYYIYDSDNLKYVLQQTYIQGKKYYIRTINETANLLVTSICEYKNSNFNKTCIRLKGSKEVSGETKSIELYYDLSTGKLSNNSETDIQLCPTAAEIQAIDII